MKIQEWVGSIIFLVALIEFVSSPKKALNSIPDVLATNVRIINNRMVVIGPGVTKSSKGTPFHTR